MNIKLVSSLTKGFWAIEEEAAYGAFPKVQAILNGTHTAFEDDDDDEDEPVQLVDAEEVEGQTAVLQIIGPVTHYGGMCSYGMVDYAAMITSAADNPYIWAMVLDMDTPGGQVDGTEVVAAAIDYFRQTGKPIIGFCESGMVASAGVWMWSYCTERYVASEICRVGSIGVLAWLQDARKAMEQDGIKQILIRAPQSQDKIKDYTDAIDGKTKAYEAQLQFICDRFLTVVSTELDGQLTTDEWKTGKMFFAADAQRIGLITGIKSRAEVMARAEELAQTQNENTPMFKPKFSALSALAGTAAASITAEQVAAVNEQIVKAGIAGVTMALDSDLATYENSAEEIANLTAQAATHATTISAKDAEIAALQTKVTALEGKVKTKPAVEATSVTAPKEKIEGTEAEPEYEATSIDKEKAAMKAKWA
jgi:ClpP class serine protease